MISKLFPIGLLFFFATSANSQSYVRENSLYLGEKSKNDTVTIFADTTAKPFIRYDTTLEKWVFSNDGSSSQDLFKGANTSSNNGVPRFDGASGKILKTSAASIDDDGVLSSTSFSATDTSKTSTISGLQILDTQITSTGSKNLSLKAGASGTTSIVAQGDIVPMRTVTYNAVDDTTTTGTGTTLDAFTTSYVRLKNASLVSLNMIPTPAGSGAKELTFINGTANTITLNHDTGATATARINTVTGLPYKLAKGSTVSLVYDYFATRWVIKGTSGVTIAPQGSAGITTSKIDMPQSQATNLSNGNIRLETGNTNLLADPSFEQNPLNTDVWKTRNLSGAAACTLDTAASGSITLGARSLQVECSGLGVAEIYQTVTTVKMKASAEFFALANSTLGNLEIVIYADGVETFKTSYAKDVDAYLTKVALTDFYTGSSTTTLAIRFSRSVAGAVALIRVDDAKLAYGTGLIADIKNDSERIYYTPQFQGFGTVATSNTFYVRDGTDIIVTASWTTVSSTATEARIYLPNGLQIASDFTGKKITGRYSTSFSNTNIHGGSANILASPDLSYVTFAGEGSAAPVFTDQLGNAISSSTNMMATFRIPIKGWKSSSSALFQNAEKFDSDTANLVWKASAIVDGDPVGTFNTFSYATSTNTKTICGTAPTQTIADMKANGFKIHARAYNAASTCALPARFEVKLGKGMAYVTPSLYKNTGKDTSGSLDLTNISSTIISGFTSKEYTTTTGVAIYDAGQSPLGADTTRNLYFSDISTSFSGYLHIFAQKAQNMAAMAIDAKNVVGMEYVGFTAARVASQSIPNAVGTAILWDTVYKDTASRFNISNGKYTIPVSGFYQISSSILSNGDTFASNSLLQLAIVKNGAEMAAGRVVTTATSVNLAASVNSGDYLLAGDVIEVQVFQNRGGSMNLIPTGSWNKISIFRIPGFLP